MGKRKGNKYDHMSAEEALLDIMERTAAAIDTVFNGKKRGPLTEVGFCLLVFPRGYAGDGRVNYISNVEREDMLVLLKDQIKFFETPEDVVGHA